MTWFEKIMPSRIKTERRTRSVPEGLWIKCPACDAVLYRAELDRNLQVCPKCSHHMRIGARDRLSRFLDEGSQHELAIGVEPEDLSRAQRSDAVRLLLACYAERARIFYERAERALAPEDRRVLRPAEAMGRIYRHLLETVHREGFQNLETPRRLSKPRRIAIAAGTWLGLGATA